jgi:hypothetical protein
VRSWENITEAGLSAGMHCMHRPATTAMDVLVAIQMGTWAHAIVACSLPEPAAEWHLAQGRAV